MMTKIKGFIFHGSLGGYYLRYNRGCSHNRKLAYVYSLSEAVAYCKTTIGWGSKLEGHWVVVYE